MDENQTGAAASGETSQQQSNESPGATGGESGKSGGLDEWVNGLEEETIEAQGAPTEPGAGDGGGATKGTAGTADGGGTGTGGDGKGGTPAAGTAGAGAGADGNAEAEDEPDVGGFTAAYNQLREQKAEVEGKASKLEEQRREFDAAVETTKTRYREQLDVGTSVLGLRGRDVDPVAAMKLVYGPDVDLTEVMKKLGETPQQITPADVERIAEQKARKLREDEKAEETKANEARTREQQEKRAGDVNHYRTLATGWLNSVPLDPAKHPRIAAASELSDMTEPSPGFAERIIDVGFQGAKPLTLGDRLLTVADELWRSTGKPVTPAQVLEELEKRLAPKTDAAASNGQPKPTNGTTTPSAQGGAAAIPKPTRAKDIWDDLYRQLE